MGACGSDQKLTVIKMFFLSVHKEDEGLYPDREVYQKDRMIEWATTGFRCALEKYLSENMRFVGTAGASIYGIDEVPEAPEIFKSSNGCAERLDKLEPSTHRKAARE